MIKINIKKVQREIEHIKSNVKIIENDSKNGSISLISSQVMDDLDKLKKMVKE